MYKGFLNFKLSFALKQSGVSAVHCEQNSLLAQGPAHSSPGHAIKIYL